MLNSFTTFLTANPYNTSVTVVVMKPSLRPVFGKEATVVLQMLCGGDKLSRLALP